MFVCEWSVGGGRRGRWGRGAWGTKRDQCVPGTWGLTDVGVRVGLADGRWADVWVGGGGARGVGVGGVDGAQSVTSVCLEPGA